MADFNIRKMIGKGSFGKVLLVEKKDTKVVYAMKTINKSVLIENDQLESTILEKNILLQENHPFLLSMDYVF